MRNKVLSWVLSAAMLLSFSPVLKVSASATPTITVPLAGGCDFASTIKSDGTVWTWGENASGQLGNGSDVDEGAPVRATGVSGAVALASGHSTAYALAGGAVWAWGENTYGQLGNGTNTGSNVPAAVSGLPAGITAIASRLWSCYALGADGSVWAWGHNESGQLGIGNTDSSSTPSQVRSIIAATAIAAADYAGYAVVAGEVWAWGRNTDGELGNSSIPSSLVPVKVNSLSGVTAIAAGFYTAYALKSDGTVWAWGSNSYGQLGKGSSYDGDYSYNPFQVQGLPGDIRAIAAEGYGGYAIDSAGNVWSWGSTGNSLDINTSAILVADSSDPGGFLTNVVAVAGGFNNAFAVKADGSVWSWGTRYVLGNGTLFSYSRVPVQVSGFGPAATATCSENCGTALAEGGFDEFTMIDGEKYYHISTAAQLAHISEHLDLNYIQTEDIDLSQYNGGYWTPIGGFGNPDASSDPYTGKYLGDSHAIHNLNISFDDRAQSCAYGGVFAWIEGAEAGVDGLTVYVESANIAAENEVYFGAIAGVLYGGSITACHAVYEGDADSSNTPQGSLGGIVGESYEIWDSFSGEYSTPLIDDCSAAFNFGSLIADGEEKCAGGIVGYSYRTQIHNCNVEIAANEIIRGTTVGGIAGELFAKVSEITGNAVESCLVTGDGRLMLSSQEYYDYYIGGIAGEFSEGNIENCRNEVRIDADDVILYDSWSGGLRLYAGGLVGYIGSGSYLYGCQNTGAVYAEAIEGVYRRAVGIMSIADDPPLQKYVFAGGIGGYISGYSRQVTIENCENNADISSVNSIPRMRAYAGGLVGHADSFDGDYAGVRILNCANLGADKAVFTQGGTTMTGGLLGSTTFHDFVSPNITISNCYNLASVISESNSEPAEDGTCVGITAGGIIGAVGEADVQFSYSTAQTVEAVPGDVGDAYEGGLLGVMYMTSATQNYYENNDSILYAVGGAGMDLAGSSDVPGAYEGATAVQLKTKNFFGSGWSWYESGGSAPDYYSSSFPWRMTAADSYPVLKGTPYTEPVSSAATYYSVSAGAGAGGSIAPAGNIVVEAFQQVTFTITPENGYVISDVLVDGVSVGAVSNYTFPSATANHTVEAIFERPVTRFTDVDSGMWYSEGIDFVVAAGLFEGTSATTFEPNRDMTRAMLVTVLCRLENEPDLTVNSLFSDIAHETWYTRAVAWAAENNIVQGYDSETFGPDDPITREQIAAVLYRFADYKGYDLTPSEDLASFSDSGEVSGWALNAVKWAVAEGLLEGSEENRLEPGGNASRAQIAVILMRFIEKH